MPSLFCWLMKRLSHLGKAERKTVEVKKNLCFYRVFLGKIKVKTYGFPVLIMLFICFCSKSAKPPRVCLIKNSLFIGFIHKKLVFIEFLMRHPRNLCTGEIKFVQS